MIEANPDEKELALYMDYCTKLYDSGSFRYLSEVSVLNERYDIFLAWLEKCEKAGFSYLFVTIERYEGVKLLYGFTNFDTEVYRDAKIFSFSVSDNDVLTTCFSRWEKEGGLFVLPSRIYFYFHALAKGSEDGDNS